MFRGSVGSNYGKQLRWAAEAKIQPYLQGKIISRNQLMNESADWYLDRSAETTDILQEYFLPRQGAIAFLMEARRIIRRRNADLLNVTVRDVGADDETVMNYARGPVLAFVMFFSQARTPVGDSEMQALTRELIDASVKFGGRYYLPYRLHATDEEFRRAYPQAARFFELKRQYDPAELFQNQFYLRYGKRPSAP